MTVSNARSRELSQSWRDRNKERHRTNAERWRLSHRLRTVILGARSRAKARGYVFDLTLDWFDNTDKLCSYCGQELYFHRGKLQGNSLTIDRLEPALGYTKQNSVLCCWECNRLKYDMSIDRLVALAATVQFLAQQRGIRKCPA